MGLITESLESLEAEVQRLRRQNADLLVARDTRPLGLVWERGALPAEDDAARSFVPDLVVSEDGAPVSMLENDPGNVIIEGNNIAALRMLMKTHAGAFDCILIDPPYGTGNTTWLYNDQFVDPRNRFRGSAWLSWIEPRLECARDLLSPAGCLLVCIDDTKRAMLDLLMEQVMPGKRIGSIVWRTRQGANDHKIKNLSIDHEHLLVYANPDFEFGGNPKSYSMYRHYDEGSDDPYRISDLTTNVAFDDKRAGNGYYPLLDTKTGIWYPCNPNAVWRFGSEKYLKPGKKNRKDTMEQLVAKGRVVFPKGRRTEFWESKTALLAAIAAEDVPKNGKGVPLLRADLPSLDFWVGKRIGWGIPQLKRYKSELTNGRQPLSSWIRSTADKERPKDGDQDREIVTAGLNREGSSHLSSLMGGKVFNYPKPVSMIAGVLRQATSPGSLVLDFFAGSGTTGEAVMRLNAEDQGMRRFFLVSNTEANPGSPDRNLCRDVCARRIRAAVASSATESDVYTEALQTGFAYLRLAEYDPIERSEALTPDRTWTLIQLRHGCPIHPWRPKDGVDLAEALDGRTIALMPRPTEAGIARLKSTDLSGAKNPVIVYTPYPSRVRPLLPEQNVEVIDSGVIEPGEAFR